MGLQTWRIIIMLSMCVMRKQVLLATTSPPLLPSSAFIARSTLTHSCALHSKTCKARPRRGLLLTHLHAALRPSWSFLPAASSRFPVSPGTQGKEGKPFSISAVRTDLVDEQGAPLHFFASITPNSPTGRAVGNSRLQLDKSMALLEEHLEEQQLQQDWVHPDPATAFFLALTLQMELQGILFTSPVLSTPDFLDLSEQAEGLAEKVVAHLAAHPELRSSPFTASASAAAASATAGSSSGWRKAVEDDSGGSMVGDGMMSAAAHLLEVDITKLSVTVEGLMETVYPPPQASAACLFKRMYFVCP